MNIEIKNRNTGEIIVTGEYESIKEALETNKQIDLSEADLANANLSHAELSGINLANADLSGVNLTKANLTNAILSDVDLSNANLFYTDLSNANLANANLSNAILAHAILTNADLSNVTNYVDSYDVAMEIVYRQSQEFFTSEEWTVLEEMNKQRDCWSSFKTLYDETITSIATKLAGLGYGDYLDKLNNY